MKNKVKKIITVLGVFLFCGSLSAQLVNTDRTLKNLWLAGDNTLCFGAAGTSCINFTNDALTFSAGDTGDSSYTFPKNSVGPDTLVGAYKELIFCGENAENGTIYFGPSTGHFGGNGADLSQGGTACDALDNATEATADAPISTLATKIHGLYCTTDATLGADETITFKLRTAEGDAVTTDGDATTVGCIISEGESACRVNVGTTTNIAAGAAIAMSVVQVSDNSDGDESWCSTFVSFP